jgi:hypothetical protein
LGDLGVCKKVNKSNRIIMLNGKWIELPHAGSNRRLSRGTFVVYNSGRFIKQVKNSYKLDM